VNNELKREGSGSSRALIKGVIVVLSGWTNEKQYNELVMAEIGTRDLRNMDTILCR